MKHTLFLIMIFISSGFYIESFAENTSFNKDNIEKIMSLQNKKIFFGHQSVGENVLDGVRDILKNNPEIKLNIVESTDIGNLEAPVIAHSKIGKNRHPDTKLIEFSKLIENGIGGSADIAFFKYCFADFDDNTNIDKIFHEYKTVMATLKQKYPDTIFIHMTVPLSQTKITFKTKIKEIMGKNKIWEYSENISKNKFNEKIKKEYAGKEPIFDIAMIESTYPNQEREKFKHKGKTYYAMVPDYTYDGSHLNELGRKEVANKFLLFLSGIPVK